MLQTSLQARVRSLPGNLLLKLRDSRHIEHYSKIHSGLQGIFVQLLFQRLVQIYPSALVLLVVIPQTEICNLKGGHFSDETKLIFAILDKIHCYLEIKTLKH